MIPAILLPLRIMVIYDVLHRLQSDFAFTTLTGFCAFSGSKGRAYQSNVKAVTHSCRSNTILERGCPSRQCHIETGQQLNSVFPFFFRAPNHV